MDSRQPKERATRAKVSIIGAGMVGGTAALYLAQREYADIALVDIVDGLPQGKALDIREAGPVLGYDVDIVGSTDYAVTSGSDVVVITSGIARKPGMSRDDLLRTNMGIVRSVTEQVTTSSPDAVIIVVSNPLDAMCHVAFETAGFPRERIIGQAGVLDSARFRTFIAEELNVSARDVTAFVLGGHGDSMVPLSRYSTVGGIPITELITADRVKHLEQRTADGGAEIVSLLKSGSAYVAPAASVIEMVDAIVLDQHRVLPCSVLLSGEYGIDGLFVGVPVTLGRGGVEDIIEIALRDSERSSLRESADMVQILVDAMRRMDEADTSHSHGDMHAG